VASAVLDADEHALAAISVSGPSERMSKERMKGLCHPILNACTQVRYVLGAS
jgi:DNA-binding IclR family transcriptional regulator